MLALRKFFNLSRRDRLLLMRAAVRVLAAVVLVRFFPYSILKKNLQVGPVCAKTLSPYVSAERAVWAVEAAARRMPGTTCLSNALACRSLLARHGYRANLRIGVAKDATGKIASHAWLELRGSTLIGGVTSPHEYAILDFPSL
jgi:hypothetical protein